MQVLLLIITAGLILFTGLGLRVALLSYITSLARPGLRGRLYGLVQVVETIAQLITWPLTEHVVINIGKDNSWVELPFFFTSVRHSVLKRPTIKV